MFVFIPEFRAEGVFVAVFTAVSAFRRNAALICLAVKRLFCRCAGYAANPVVITVVGFLIIIGGIGFIVVYDLSVPPCKAAYAAYARYYWQLQQFCFCRNSVYSCL